jgi:flagellar basal-body rod protein FlgB
MIGRLDRMLDFHATALKLRVERQQVLASNIVNAEVPGFKARDIDFRQALQAALDAKAKSGDAGAPPQAPLLYRVPRQDSIDGNTVEMDVERAQFADNALHLEANLTFMTSDIKAMLAALQG